MLRLRYAEVATQARRFLALTGYTVPEFEALLPAFTQQVSAYLQTHTLRGKPRKKRRYQPYKNAVFPTFAEILLFILVYLKQAVTQEVLACLFGIQQPDANQWVHLFEPLLNAALEASGEKPARDAEALQAAGLEAGDYFQDGTERPIVRPKDREAQKQYYSGKKRRHTVKNLVVNNAAGKVVFLTPTEEGKKHDKKVADEAGYTLPEGSRLHQDTGFQGFALEGTTIIQPKKKPRSGELTAEEKAANRAKSQVRVRSEHTIGGVKRYRIVKDQSRNWKEGFRDRVMETCCALHNFRLNFRPWRYEAQLAKLL
jgi:hypothetical protein